MSRKTKRRKSSKKQKTIMMVGCAHKCNCGRKCGCGKKTFFCSKCNHKCKKCNHSLKGGYGCGSTGCPIAPYKMGGGLPMPGPFVGQPWSPSNLPGEDGVGGNRNYFEAYDVTKNPAYQMSMNDSGYLTKSSTVGGSRKRRYTKRRMRGGGLVPQDLVNLGRDFTYNFKSAYNALNGYDAPVNPAPYKDQLLHNRF